MRELTKEGDENYDATQRAKGGDKGRAMQS